MSIGHWGTTALPGVLKSQHKRVEVVWETLPPHPVVMAETTAMHRQIRALGVSDGVMLLGYGDWTENLGPVKVIGYDLSTLEPVTLMTQPPELGSEAWSRIRIIDGKAYLPHTDPTLNNQGAYTTNDRGFWETVKVGNNPSMIHTFDVIRFKGRMLVCGSMSAGGGAGCVYTETAPGSRTFTRTLLGVSRADFARFYKFFVRDEGNEVMVQNSAGGLESFVTTDGDTWTAAPGEPQQAGVSSPNDPPGPLPVGWPSENRYATVEHEGWLWVTLANGVVKRARLP